MLPELTRLPLPWAPLSVLCVRPLSECRVEYQRCCFKVFIVVASGRSAAKGKDRPYFKPRKEGMKEEGILCNGPISGELERATPRQASLHLQHATWEFLKPGPPSIILAYSVSTLRVSKYPLAYPPLARIERRVLLCCTVYESCGYLRCKSSLRALPTSK